MTALARIQRGNHLLVSSPDALEQVMRGSVGDFRVPEAPSSGFRAALEMFQLPRSVFFSIQIPNSRVTLSEGSGFVSVNIVSTGHVKTFSPTRGKEWGPGTAYAVNHDIRKFDFQSDEKFNASVLCFRNSLLLAYAKKFNAGETSELDVDQEFDLNTDIGGSFYRYLEFVWNELNRGGGFLRSTIAMEEIEDSLLALFLSATQIGTQCRVRNRSTYIRLVKSAEEFILGHLAGTIRVADIAFAVGVSVPTLNRAFRKCHGTGPKAFVKQRRLDRVRNELVAANSTANTVTEVAVKYGFWHLSQFAADYQKQFGELPSHTLREK